MMRIHDYGYEIVSSAESFTITAGGHTTEVSKTATSTSLRWSIEGCGKADP